MVGLALAAGCSEVEGASPRACGLKLMMRRSNVEKSFSNLPEV
jgi:hypothetical protein